MNIPVINDTTMTLIHILIIIGITLLMTRFIAYVMNKVERFKDDMTAAYLVRDIITYVIYFIALMVILQYFGINLAGTLLSVGIVGIAVRVIVCTIVVNTIFLLVFRRTAEFSFIKKTFLRFTKSRSSK